MKAVLVRLCQNLDYPSPSILEALKEIEIIMEKGREISVRSPDLNRSMTFNEDVYATGGMLLVSKGEEATYPMDQPFAKLCQGYWSGTAI